MGDMWRTSILLELCVLLFCAGYLHHGYRTAIPRILFLVGYAYGAVLFSLAIAIGINLVSGEPISPGLRVFAVLTAPVTVFTACATAIALAHHRPRSTRRNP